MSCVCSSSILWGVGVDRHESGHVGRCLLKRRSTTTRTSFSAGSSFLDLGGVVYRVAFALVREVLIRLIAFRGGGQLGIHRVLGVNLIGFLLYLAHWTRMRQILAEVGVKGDESMLGGDCGGGGGVEDEQ